MICWARPLIKVYSLIQRLDCERICKEESKPFIQGQDHTWSDFVPVSPCNSQRWQGLLCITLLHCFVPFCYFAILLLNSQQSKYSEISEEKGTKNRCYKFGSYAWCHKHNSNTGSFKHFIFVFVFILVFVDDTCSYAYFWITLKFTSR